MEWAPLYTVYFCINSHSEKNILKKKENLAAVDNSLVFFCFLWYLITGGLSGFRERWRSPWGSHCPREELGVLSPGF